jgi:hypothetical protein
MHERHQRVSLGYGLVEEAIRDASSHEAHSLLARLMMLPECSGRAFAVSLTEHSDQLSQWRAYADDGAGFSIGSLANGCGLWRARRAHWVTTRSSSQ